MKVQQDRELSVIAGMDPSGGAGLLRDLWVCAQLAPGLPVRALCSALTRQDQGRAAESRLEGGAGFALRLAQLRAGIWKVGMLGPDAVTAMLVELEGRSQRPLVVLDPVQRASAGGQLGAPPELLAKLWPYCAWVTPNRSEALALGAKAGEGDAPWRLAQTMEQAAWWIKSVLVQDAQIWDELHLQGQVYRICRAKAEGPDPRGTGCALSTALAVFCSQGFPDLSGGATLWHWEGGSWVLVPSLSAALRAKLGPVLAASQWLADARQTPLKWGNAWFLPLELASGMR